MDIRLALMCGTDIPLPECQLVIHQPRIKEIALQQVRTHQQALPQGVPRVP